MRATKQRVAKGCLILAGLAGLLLLCICSRILPQNEKPTEHPTQQQSAPQATENYEYENPFAAGEPCKVQRVIDGDTILVTSHGQEERVRLLCINVNDTDPVAQERGREVLRKMVEGKEVRLEFETKEKLERDTYGRLLAYIFLGGLNINTEMVRLGCTPYWTKYSRSKKYEDVFLAAEAQAKSNRVGIWAVTMPPQQNPPQAAQPHQNPPAAAPHIETPAPANNSDQVIVYITKTGAKYHRAGCSYLKKSVIPMSLKDAKAAGYTPCSRCNPPQ